MGDENMTLLQNERLLHFRKLLACPYVVVRFQF